MADSQDDPQASAVKNLITGPIPLGPAILDTLAGSSKRIAIPDLKASLASRQLDLSTFDDDLEMLKFLKVVSGRKTFALTDRGRDVNASFGEATPPAPPPIASMDDQVIQAVGMVLSKHPLGPAIVRTLGDGPKPCDQVAAAVGAGPDDFPFIKVMGLLNLYTRPGFKQPIVIAPSGSDLRSLGDLGAAVWKKLPPV